MIKILSTVIGFLFRPWFWVVLALLAGFKAYNYYRLRPELWNSKAKSYLTHTKNLQVDSVVTHGVIVLQNGIIANQADTIARQARTIDTLTTRWQAAITYGQQWKAGYESRVALLNASADKMSDTDRQKAFYRALLANGSYQGKADINTLLPGSPDVIRAGLVTANREKVATAALDTVSQTIGVLTDANEHLERGLSGAKTAMTTASATARKNAPRAILFINRRAHKRGLALADSLDKAAKQVGEVSEMEDLLNSKKRRP